MTTPSDPAPQTPPPPAPEPQASPPRYWEPPKEEPGPAPGVRFASYGPRLVAYVIDGLIVGLVFFVIFIVFGGVLLARGGFSDFRELTPEDVRTGNIPPGMVAAFAGFGIVSLAGLLVTLAYFPYFWARSGQTPGMRPFGLYVVRDADGGKISIGQAILRLIGMWVSAAALYIGFIWVFVDPRRRGWHDLIAGTVVIERTQRG